MADFLPIGLSRDDGGVVSGLKEITTSDTIPENYLTISNTDPKWNSSALQGFAICDTSPTAAGTNPALVWNGLTWCASVITAAAVGGGGNGNATAINGYPIDPTAVPNEGEVLRWDGGVWSYQPTATFRDYDATSIYGFPIDISNQGPGRVLVFDGTDWNYEPTSVYVTPTPPNYNATAIDGYSVTSINRAAGKVLVFDGSLWNYEPTSVYVAGGGGGVTGIGVPGEITRWLTTTSIETAGFSITPPTTDGRILKWNNATTAIDDLGYTQNDAQWNANYIQGVSALIPTQANNNYVLTYDYGENKLTWTRKFSQIGPTPFNSLGVPQTEEGQTGLTFGFTIPGASGTSATLYTFPTSGQYSTSSFGVGTFFVTSGNTIVPAFLPDSLLRFYGATNGSFPTKAPPAELLKTGGELLYYDTTNDRYTNTGNVKVVGANNLTATNLSGTGIIQGTTVSATNYLNLPSSTIVWASANYATLAGSATSALIAQNATSATIALNATSATSALNAQQAPNNFSVTGNVSATSTIQAATLSATNYLNLPSATTEWYQAQQAQAIVKYVKNQTGATLAKGTAVTVTGVAGDTPLVANLSSVNNHVPEATGFANHVFGLVQASIAHDAFGYVVTEGLVSGTGGDNLNTDAFNVTDVLYVSSNGQLNNIRPPAPYEGHPIGYVLRKHANVGAIYVKVETTPEINDIVGFNLASSLINGDLISYDTTTSTFKNVQAINVSGQGKFGSVSATNISGTTITATNYNGLPASFDATSIVGLNINLGLGIGNDGDIFYWDGPGNQFSTIGSGVLLSGASVASATLAGSATSAVNAQQAPNGFNVTGTVLATTVSATTVSAGEAIYVDGGTGYIVNPAGSISLSAVGGTVNTNVTTNIANGSGNIFLRAGRAGIYTDTAASAYYIAPNNYSDPRMNFVVAQTSAGDSYVGAKSGQSISFVVPSNTLSSITTANRLMQIEASGINVRTGIVSTSSIIANTVSATTYLNLPSGTITWTNATSATSALNARQAPAGFDVTGMLTAASGDVSSTRLTDYSEKKSAPTISSSALTLDLNNSQVFTVALNSNISTLTISNPDPRSNTAQGFTLILTADGTARTITWPASVKWPSATGPTLTSTNNKVDILSFLSPDNGTTWYGFIGGQNF